MAGRDADLGQHVLRPERGLEHAGEERARRDRALAAWAARDEVGVEGEQHRRQVGGGIAVRDRAADRAAVAHLRIADERRRLGERRAALGEQRIGDEVGVARQRADRDPVAVLADVAELLQPADVDEERRAGRSAAAAAG